jgi:hypothetical protein
MSTTATAPSSKTTTTMTRRDRVTLGLLVCVVPRHARHLDRERRPAVDLEGAGFRSGGPDLGFSAAFAAAAVVSLLTAAPGATLARLRRTPVMWPGRAGPEIGSVSTTASPA